MTVSQNAKMDGNMRQTLTAVANDGSGAVVQLYANPTTHRLLVDNANTGLVVGTSTISGGTNGYFLYDNNGVLGEQAAGSGTVTSVSVVTANGISGTVANNTTTPAITLALGAITPSAVNVSGLTASQIVATDGSMNLQTLAVATYPSLTELSYVKGVTSAIQTQINAKGAGTVTAVSVATANGFSGSSSGGATPALTIVAGAITPTSVNGLTITTTTGTLTIASGKTTTVNNSLTLAGTDSTTMTFPSTSASVARTDAAQTFTGTQTFSQVITTANTVTVTSNAGTVPVTSKINNFTNSSASAMTITLATSSAVDGQSCIVRIFDASAATKGITWLGTENSANVTAPANSAGSTTIPLTVGFIYNGGTSKWTCIAYA